MKYKNPRLEFRSSRTFIANLLAFLLLASQLAPLAAAQGARAGASRGQQPAKSKAQEPGKGGGVGGGEKVSPVLNAPAAVSITATKSDNVPLSTQLSPGATINYTVTITNNGTEPATGVQFTDTPDANTALVNGSISTQPIANPDAYNVIGNVQITPNATQGLLANDCDPDNAGCTNTGLTISVLAGDNTAPFAGTSLQGGQVTSSTTDGAFNYNPPAGFTGTTDSFTYTITDAQGKTDTATVSLAVGNGTATPGDNVIWFIDDSAPAGGDGRLTSPFNCYTGPDVPAVSTCFSNSAADEAGDSIFLFDGGYTGGNALLNNQKLIGAGATASLADIAVVTVQPYSTSLPATGGAAPTITTTLPATHAVPLAQDNTLRGFAVGNTTGAKIFGNNFGTVRVGDSASPDVSLAGTGQALNLTNGSFHASSGFAGVGTSGALGASGITLTTVGGTVLFGATSVSGAGAQGINISGSAVNATFGTTSVGATTQGILIGTSTGNIVFGATTVTGGTDAVSLQNNSNGSRTFASLTTSGNSGVGFLHAVGGATTVTGATSITSPGGAGIQISQSNAAVTFGATSVDKGSTAGMAVAISNSAGQTTTFSTLDLNSTNAAGVGLFIQNGGNVNVSTAAGSEITAPQLIDINVAALGLNFANLASTNGPASIPAIRVIGASGALVSAATNIQNPGNFGLNIDGNSAAFTFGNTIVSGSAGTGVFLNNNTAAVSFADLDISPDLNQAALHATNNTGTITTTSGDIVTNNGVALDIAGANAGARTPLAMALTLVNVPSSGSASGGVNLNFVSGSLSVSNPAGIDTNVDNTNGFGIQVRNSTAAINFGDTDVTGSGGTGVILGTASNGNTGAITFGSLGIAPDSGQRALHSLHSTGAITTASGTITTTNATAVHVEAAAAGSKTPLNVQLTTVTTNGGGAAPNGIFLRFASATGSPGGFRVLGTGGTCTAATPTCTGGRITATSGADNTNNGIGVYMEDVASVVLTRMRLDGHPNFAVRGKTVAGFTLDTSVVNGDNGTSQSGDNDGFDSGEDAVRFAELTGSAAITNSDISGGFLNTLRVTNSTGVLNRLTVTNSIIGGRTNNGTNMDDGFIFTSRNSATMNLTVTGTTFTTGRGDVFNPRALGSSTMDVIFRQNTVSNNHPSTVTGGGGTTVASSTSAAFTYDISCNKFFDNQNAAVNAGLRTHMLLVFKGAGSTGSMTGTIFNNTFGTPGVAGSGSGPASSALVVDTQGSGTGTVLVKNNTIRRYDETGIKILSADGSATVNATVIGNLTLEPNGPNALAGLYVEAGATSTDSNTINLRVGSATVAAEKNNFTAGDPIDFSDVSIGNAGIGNTAKVNLSRAGSASGTILGVINDDNISPNTVNNYGAVLLVNTTPTLPPAIAENCSPPAAPVEATEIVSESAAQTAAAPAQAAPQPVFILTYAPHVGQPVVPVAQQQAAAAAAAAAAITTAKPDKATAAKPSAKETSLEKAAKPVKRIVAPSDHDGTVHVNIGTLAPTDSVQITFSVTIDNPFPAGVTQVSNQGTVSGTNFTSVLTDDDDPASPAGPADPTVTLVLGPPDVSIKNASTNEPVSGSKQMAFPVVLSNPFPSTVTVNYATTDGTATGGAACGTAGVDYKTAADTISFAPGQTVQSVSVEVCSDADAGESNETFTVTLSAPSNANIAAGAGTATGTIKALNEPGDILISEIRTSGPGGLEDDFVELYNNKNEAVVVPAGGWGLFRMGASCADTPVLIATIPAGTIPARGHYLITGAQYSLANYGGTGAAAGDLTFALPLGEDANVGLFTTTNVADISTETRLDAVGFGANTGNNCDLLSEGATLPAAGGSLSEHSFVRNMTTGQPLDRNNNATDFLVVSTTPATAVGSNATPRLGAPGPERSDSPINRSSSIKASLVDMCVSSSAPPNRERDNTVVTNGASGTISIRRKFTNTTGGDVTRLRFRIIDTTTVPTGPGDADLRALTSGNVSVGINPACGGGTVNVLGTTLEEPPAQPNGGGWNSTLSAGTITLATPLAAGASINVQFLLGVEQPGNFRFFIVVEALPGGPPFAPGTGGKGAGETNVKNVGREAGKDEPRN